MLNLKIIVGSTRPGRAADRVIPWITALSRQHGAFDAELIDLRDWDLPMFGENLATVGDPRNPAFSAPVVRRWNDTIAAGSASRSLRADGEAPPSLLAPSALLRRAGVARRENSAAARRELRPAPPAGGDR